MPLVAHNALPTFDRLRRDGITVLSTERAAHQEIRELHVGLLNMMPDAALEATERQFYRLVGESNPIAQFYMHPFTLPTLPRGEAAQAHIAQYLRTLRRHPREGAGRAHHHRRQRQPPQPRRRAVLGAADRGDRLGLGPRHLDPVLVPRHPRGDAVPPRPDAGEAAAARSGACSSIASPTAAIRWWPTSTPASTCRIRAGTTSRARSSRRPGSRCWSKARRPACIWRSASDGLRTVFFQGHPEYDTVSLLKEYKRDLLLAAAGKLSAFPPFPERYFNRQAQALLAEFGQPPAGGRDAGLPRSAPAAAARQHLARHRRGGDRQLDRLRLSGHPPRARPALHAGHRSQQSAGTGVTAARAHFDEAQGALIASGVWQAECRVCAAEPGRQDRAHSRRRRRHPARHQRRVAAAGRGAPAGQRPDARTARASSRSIWRCCKLVAQHSAATAAQPEPPREGVRALTGRGTLAMWGHLVGLLDFIGRLFIELMALMPQPGALALARIRRPGARRCSSARFPS